MGDQQPGRGSTVKQTFSTPLTPSAARRIVRMADINSRVEIDPLIREIAAMGVVDPAAVAKLTDEGKEAVQQLLDLDLRAAVALPNNGPRRVDWLSPILAAAKHRGGFKNILLGGDYRTIDIEWEIRAVLGDVMVADYSGPQHEESEFLKQRAQTLYIHSNMTGFVGSLPSGTGIFYHSVYVALQRLTSNLQMLPHMPTLHGFMGSNSQKLLSRGFKTSARQVSFMFNIVNALNRDTSV